MSGKLNLHQKLVEVRKSIKGFNKDTKAGSGSYVGYEYVSGSQILRAIKGKMDELGILLIPEVDYDTMHWEKHNYKTKSGIEKTDFIITMKMNYTWVNAEDPNDKITIPWVCIGQQTDDISKAVGTAMTYNERYFLLKFLGLPTDEDDADAKPFSAPINKQFNKPTTEPIVKPTDDGFATVSFEPVGPKDYTITANQLKRFYTIATKTGIGRDIIEGQIKKEFGCEPKELTKSQYDIVCKRLEAKIKK